MAKRKKERFIRTGGGRLFLGPLTAEQEFEFYKRTGNGIKTMTLPRASARAQEIPEPEKSKK